MKPIGIGIIGLDHWYNALPFLDQVARSRRFTLVGVAHRDTARAEQALKGLPSGYTTADPDVLLRDPDVRVVASFTTIAENARWCVAAAKRGKHVLAGKPLAMTLAQASEVVAASNEHDVIVFPFESYGRVMPLYRTMKRWIDEGRIGDLLTIDCTHDAALPVTWEDDPSPGWWTQPEHTPGGGWIDHSVYQLDVIRYLSGQSITSIAGHTARLRHTTLSLEDYGYAVITLSGNVRASSKAHWLVPRGTFRRVVEVTGSAGMILFDSVSDTVRVRGDFETEVIDHDPAATLPDPHARLPMAPQATPVGPGWRCFGTTTPDQPGFLEYVGDLIEGRQEPAADAHDGYANLEAALAFYDQALPT